jgi:predicted transglutaminase-like cysteine proteinase
MRKIVSRIWGLGTLATRTVSQTTLAGLAFILAASTLQAQTLASLPSGNPVVEKQVSAKPILGWVKFCERNPTECAFDSAEEAVVTLTQQVWSTINSVNKKVNSDISAITDQEHWGVVDQWSMPVDGKGDCEDFQLLKRKLLAEAGISRRAMRMTVVIDELGEGHAVLMVRTDKGDFILDNKTSSIVSWDQTGYSFVKRESQESQSWVSLGGITRSPTTTANR